jgi:hypothetical protein
LLANCHHIQSCPIAIEAHTSKKNHRALRSGPRQVSTAPANTSKKSAIKRTTRAFSSILKTLSRFQVSRHQDFNQKVAAAKERKSACADTEDNAQVVHGPEDYERNDEPQKPQKDAASLLAAYLTHD